MKTPRQVDGSDLARALRVLGYERVRQDGSHIRLTTQAKGTHHVTVPNHKPLKRERCCCGVLKPVAGHHRLTVEELLHKLNL